MTISVKLQQFKQIQGPVVCEQSVLILSYLTKKKALSLHLPSAIDLGCPSFCGDFSSSQALNAHLSLSLSSSVPPLVLCACILTEWAECPRPSPHAPPLPVSRLMCEEVAALPTSSLLIQDNVWQWRANGILLERTNGRTVVLTQNLINNWSWPDPRGAPGEGTLTICWSDLISYVCVPWCRTQF